MKAHKLSNVSVKEYILKEQETKTKHEFHNGKIYALAGGTLNHGLIGGNIYSSLRKKLEAKESTCLPFNSDVKLFIEKSNSYVYPDCMVICDEIKTAPEDENSVMNPILIIEVLSKSTSDYDRGDKFFLYRKIPSFKEYILIDQKRHIVDVHFKNENSDLWQIIRYEGINQTIKIQSLSIELTMEELYYRATISKDE